MIKITLSSSKTRVYCYKSLCKEWQINFSVANSEMVPVCNFRNAIVFAKLLREILGDYELFCKSAYLIPTMTEKGRHRRWCPSLIWHGYFRPGKEMEKNNEMTRRLE